MMAGEIVRKSISNDIAREWLTSISFHPRYYHLINGNASSVQNFLMPTNYPFNELITFYRPDEVMLTALFAILQKEIKSPEPLFILSPTAVVHTYCRNHHDCGESDEVKNYVNFLETNALEGLQKNLSVRANREKVSFFFSLFLSFIKQLIREAEMTSKKGLYSL